MDLTRSTLAVVARSLPLILIQFFIMALLVFSDQGRGFLLIQAQAFAGFVYLLMAIAAQTLAYSRLLAAEVNPTNPPTQDERTRALAVWAGSLLVAASSGLLLPILIEFHLAGSPETPHSVADSLRGSAALSVSLLMTLFIFLLIWRMSVRKVSHDEGTRDRDLALILWIIASLWVATLWHSHRFLLELVLFAAGTLLLNRMVLKNASPVKAIGGTRKLTLLFASLWLLAGSWLAVFPLKHPGSGLSLLIVIQAWTAASVLVFAALRRRPVFLWAAAACMAIISILFLKAAFRAREARITVSQTRPELVDFAGEWLRTRGSGANYPVVLVGAAGGGIRSAYWTAGILCKLSEQSPSFAGHLFGISGVSGGSVGAGVFAGLLESGQSQCGTRAAAILGKDLLAPTLNAMFTRDAVTTLIPKLPVNDRAVVLELALERAWTGTMGSHLFEEPLKLLPQGPALFLNATDAGSANPVVISNVLLGRQLGSLQAEVERWGFRLSTAVFLSARFPYVSPEARVPVDGGFRRLVDGGFADNSGASTLQAVLTALDQAAAREKISYCPVVLMVENSPEELPGSAADSSSGGWFTPLKVLDEIRAGQAAKFTAGLKGMVEARGGSFFHGFRPKQSEVEFPLGWALPASTRTEMDLQIAALGASDMKPVIDMLAKGSCKP